MTPRIPTLVLAAIVGAGSFVRAQEPSTQPAPVPAQAAVTTIIEVEPAPVPDTPEVAFLRRVEQKNKELQTLYGKFRQLRVNPMFLEEIKSRGEFWYAKPSKFRCDYATETEPEPTESRFYLLGDQGLYYTPDLNQLEKFRLTGGGDDAPINQMLVGFGVKTEKVLEVFNVRFADNQPAGGKQTVLEFISKDLERSMDFRKITVTFDTEKLEPRRLVMEEEQDVVEIDLEKIEVNPKIPDSRFEQDFPEGVEVIEH